MRVKHYRLTTNLPSLFMITILVLVLSINPIGQIHAQTSASSPAVTPPTLARIKEASGTTKAAYGALVVLIGMAAASAFYPTVKTACISPWIFKGAAVYSIYALYSIHDANIKQNKDLFNKAEEHISILEARARQESKNAEDAKTLSGNFNIMMAGYGAALAAALGEEANLICQAEDVVGVAGSPGDVVATLDPGVADLLALGAGPEGKSIVAVGTSATGATIKTFINKWLSVLQTSKGVILASAVAMPICGYLADHFKKQEDVHKKNARLLRDYIDKLKKKRALETTLASSGQSGKKTTSETKKLTSTRYGSCMTSKGVVDPKCRCKEKNNCYKAGLSALASKKRVFKGLGASANTFMNNRLATFEKVTSSAYGGGDCHAPP